MRQATRRHKDNPGWGPLARYVIAATLARTSDGGAVVAIVLVVNTSGDRAGLPVCSAHASPHPICWAPSSPAAWTPHETAAP